MVNRSGPVTLTVKWSKTGGAQLTSLLLYYGDKTLSTGSWSQVASVSTPVQNTPYTLVLHRALLALRGVMTCIILWR